MLHHLLLKLVLFEDHEALDGRGEEEHSDAGRDGGAHEGGQQVDGDDQEDGRGPEAVEQQAGEDHLLRVRRHEVHNLSSSKLCPLGGGDGKRLLVNARTQNRADVHTRLVQGHKVVRLQKSLEGDGERKEDQCVPDAFREAALARRVPLEKQLHHERHRDLGHFDERLFGASVPHHGPEGREERQHQTRLRLLLLHAPRLVEAIEQGLASRRDGQLAEGFLRQRFGLGEVDQLAYPEPEEPRKAPSLVQPFELAPSRPTLELT
mmetsp:Transcript_41336/g.93127  ORF Transcript_41336/g.93127 Transcript_41336/m.93127 type:complete len:263 (-) Transcript_41336:149-937(-)